MSKIAVDIALLPEDEVLNICIDLNRKSNNAYSNLNKKDNLPHITLAMGIIDDKDIKVIGQKLKKVSEEFRYLNLTLVEKYDEKTPDNRISSIFNLKKTKILTKLHERVMTELFPFFSYEVHLDMFYKDKDEKLSEVSSYWVKNYSKKYNHPELFRPHISLKCNKAEFDDFPLTFRAQAIMLCQLGNYCTCRKVLWKRTEVIHK